LFVEGYPEGNSCKAWSPACHEEGEVEELEASDCRENCKNSHWVPELGQHNSECVTPAVDTVQLRRLGNFLRDLLDPRHQVNNRETCVGPGCHCKDCPERKVAVSEEVDVSQIFPANCLCKGRDNSICRVEEELSQHGCNSRRHNIRKVIDCPEGSGESVFVIRK